MAQLLEQYDIFQAGDSGCNTYRIPALVASKTGVLLAFCEARRSGPEDTGEIDIVLRRSLDCGRTWQPVQTVVSRKGMTCGNPCPVLDRKSGVIRLLFSQNLAAAGEDMIVAGTGPRTVWITSSFDEGETWSVPAEITGSVKPPDWTWYATGPGHGIQLENNRLLIPCDHIAGRHPGGLESASTKTFNSHVIYSDDGGVAWKIGGTAGPATNECEAVQVEDGRIYLNCRNYDSVHSRQRAVAWSNDNGDSFSAVSYAPELVEEICQASLARLTSRREHGRNRVLFANPASAVERENLIVRLSYDECRTWPLSRVLNPGPSAYSDLAVTPDLTIVCLYERGENHAYEKITLARFNLEWLTNGADTI